MDTPPPPQAPEAPAGAGRTRVRCRGGRHGGGRPVADKHQLDAAKWTPFVTDGQVWTTFLL
ncbi:hypothetical protein, partial [Streptomyces sp. NPDC048551]|uniref:hypothetical protein n=1 Tax=Streptomyces sp. NPDC048551 TaxID=3155758 RepID=UPI00344555C1